MQLYTTQELADSFGVSRSYIHRLGQSLGIVPKRFGNTNVYTRAQANRIQAKLDKAITRGQPRGQQREDGE